eukprot:5606999-Prymnesium_polylepis.2
MARGERSDFKQKATCGQPLDSLSKGREVFSKVGCLEGRWQLGRDLQEADQCYSRTLRIHNEDGDWLHATYRSVTKQAAGGGRN